MKVFKVLAIILMVTSGKAVFAQQDTTAIKPDTALARRNDKALPCYLTVKDGLIKSDSVDVAKASQVLADELLRIRMRSHDLNDLRSLQELRKQIIADTKAMAATQNINLQRKYFANVSKGFWELASRYRFIKETTIYYQRCPMTGVTWVSNSKEINNPYYPKNMLTCGEVKGQL